MKQNVPGVRSFSVFQHHTYSLFQSTLKVRRNWLIIFGGLAKLCRAKFYMVNYHDLEIVSHFQDVLKRVETSENENCTSPIMTYGNIVFSVSFTLSWITPKCLWNFQPNNNEIIWNSWENHRLCQFIFPYLLRGHLSC